MAPYQQSIGSEFTILPTDVRLTTASWRASDAEVPPSLSGVVQTSDGSLSYPAGATIELYVGDWLRSAGVALDEDNIYANYPNGSVHVTSAKNRLTGVVINVRITYSNGEPSFSSGDQVVAEVAPSHEKMGWAGQGPEVIHLQYPRGDEGNQTYHYVMRYRQGIQFNFESSGKICTRPRLGPWLAGLGP